MLRSYSLGTRRDRRQRRLITSSCSAGLALLLVMASNSASAFCMPRSRVRSLPAHMWATTERSQLEFEQRKEEDEDEKKQISNGQSNKPLNNNVGKGLTNGERRPLSALRPDTAKEAEDDPFEIHVGRALDTLRSDYPHMLTEQPGELQIDPRSST
jgi:hypothetical protein